MNEETCWWIIIEAPGAGWPDSGRKLIHAWPAGDDPGDDELNAARTLVGFPPNDDWIEDKSGWAILLTKGRPHASLLKGAHVGAFGDLGKADSAAVAAHADARTAGYAERKATVAREVIASLSDAALAAVLAHPDVAAKLAAAKGGKP